MLVLNRLDQRDRTSLVAQIAGNKTLPDEVLARIVERTDGVPLFVEELTKSVLESGLLREQDGHYVLDGPLPPLAIPTSLHASLMARLDRLASVQRSDAGSAMPRCARSPVFLRASCKPLSIASSRRSWCFRPGHHPTPSIPSSTRLCRKRPIAVCCAIPGGNCTAGSRRRSRCISRN